MQQGERLALLAKGFATIIFRRRDIHLKKGFELFFRNNLEW